MKIVDSGEGEHYSELNALVQVQQQHNQEEKIKIWVGYDAYGSQNKLLKLVMEVFMELYLVQVRTGK